MSGDAMSTDHIRYDLLVRDALRGVVRRVVSDVAKNGLPGDHHFYISFDTRTPGVRISPRLREQYPEEMTIVLQHQFWDLSADDDILQVGLSFGGVPERLIVPFEALKGFFDPSVQFGLEFEPAAAAEAQSEDADAAPTRPSVPAAGAPVPASAKPRRGKRESASAPDAPAERPDDGGPIKQDGGAEVVRLDRFRKK
jgi:hypothetical protein